MALSYLKHQRHDQRRNQQLVVFELRQERFALPIQVAQRVVPLENLYAVSLCGQLGIMNINQIPVPILDIEHQIFGDRPANPNYTYVLTLDNPFGEPIGIPLHAPPLLCRVTEGAFQPIPPSYAASPTLRCVAALITIDEHPPVFLINPAQLIPQYASILPEQTAPSPQLQAPQEV